MSSQQIQVQKLTTDHVQDNIWAKRVLSPSLGAEPFELPRAKRCMVVRFDHYPSPSFSVGWTNHPPVVCVPVLPGALEKDEKSKRLKKFSPQVLVRLHRWFRAWSIGIVVTPDNHKYLSFCRFSDPILIKSIMQWSYRSEVAGIFVSLVMLMPAPQEVQAQPGLEWNDLWFWISVETTLSPVKLQRDRRWWQELWCTSNRPRPRRGRPGSRPPSSWGRFSFPRTPSSGQGRCLQALAKGWPWSTQAPDHPHQEPPPGINDLVSGRLWRKHILQMERRSQDKSSLHNEQLGVTKNVAHLRQHGSPRGEGKKDGNSTSPTHLFLPSTPSGAWCCPLTASVVVHQAMSWARQGRRNAAAGQLGKRQESSACCCFPFALPLLLRPLRS